MKDAGGTAAPLVDGRRGPWRQPRRRWLRPPPSGWPWEHPAAQSEDDAHVHQPALMPAVPERTNPRSQELRYRLAGDRAALLAASCAQELAAQLARVRNDRRRVDAALAGPRPARVQPSAFHGRATNVVLNNTARQARSVCSQATASLRSARTKPNELNSPELDFAATGREVT